jgi:hypothetical protein
VVLGLVHDPAPPTVESRMGPTEDDRGEMGCMHDSGIHVPRGREELLEGRFGDYLRSKLRELWERRRERRSD